jgi:hypothetical protein
VSVLGTDTDDGSTQIFTGTWHRRNPPEGRLVGICTASHHDGSPRCYSLDHGDSRDPASHMRQNVDRVVRGAGILTSFPFAHTRLTCGLGPSNPRLTIIAEETWPFRRCGFSPHYAVTHTRILIERRSSGAQAPPSTHPSPRPTHLPKEWRGIGGRLSPVHFPGP